MLQDLNLNKKKSLIRIAVELLNDDDDVIFVPLIIFESSRKCKNSSNSNIHESHVIFLKKIINNIDY